MSLINDMLRNLEAKRPDDLARQSLQREIRALPPGKSGRGKGLLLLSGLGLAVAGAVAVHQAGLLDAPLLAVAPPPPPPAVLVAPPELPAPPAMSPQAAAPDAAMSGDETLRLSSNLAVVPLPAAPVLGVPDPVVPPAPAASAKAEPVSAAAPAGPVKIEKSPVPATPRDRADAEYRKAETALASGRSGEALDGMRAALKIDPAYVQVRQSLLRQLLDMRRIDEAMAVLQEGVELMPAQTGWAMSLARLQLEHGDLAAADRSLARSQAYAEANADYAGFQGHVKSRLGAHRQAVAHYQRAARLVPSEGRWWLGLGLALEADGRVPEAREALRRALSAGTLNAELSAVAEQHLR